MDFLTSLRDVSIIASLIFSAILFISLLIFNLVGVPFVPTNRKKLKLMIDEANINSNDIVYDLGSGDGRMVIESAKAGSKNSIGFEINPFLNIWANIMAKIKKVDNTEFVTTSLWSADFSKPTKIFVYLLTSTMHKLEAKIMDEGQNGLIIISNTFKFKDLKPIKSFVKEKVYVYRIEKNIPN